jgi:hypothetical protein
LTDYPRRQIESVREKLESGKYDEVNADDAEVLLRVSDQIDLLGPSRYSDQRHEFLLKRGLAIAKGPGGLADALEDREAAEQIVTWINRTYDNPESNKDHRVGFRMIGELATEGDGKPDSIEWVPGGYPRNYDPAPRPEKMYKWDEHIVPMIEACNNSRDRALIALAWDLGPRPSELFDLVVGRFSDHKWGMKVTLYQGKQGSRSPIISPSVPYVQQWLQDHPTPDEPEAPLWTRTTRADPITNNRLRDIFKEKVASADFQQPSTPTPRRMRKSSASYLASQGVSQAHLEYHHGWNKGSPVASRYIAVFGDANDREIARAFGIEIEEDEPDPVGPRTCTRCDRETPREWPACMWCGQVLTPKAAEAAEAVEGMLADDMAESASEEERAMARGVYETTRDNPSFRADLLNTFLERHGLSSS